MKYTRFITFIFLLLFLAGCSFFQKTEEKNAVARVNEHYLYEEDIADLITEDTSEEDSALIVSNYIRRWATQQLFIDRAKVNISKEKQKEFNRLVQNYRNELFAKAYIDAIVALQLDTTVTFEEAQEYYKKNGKNFTLTEDLVKLRYINLTKNNQDIEHIEEKLRRFNKEDKDSLLNMAIQFKSYSLNDSVWVSTKEVFDKIKLLTPDDRPNLLKKQNFLQLEDSLEVYLVFIKDVRLHNEQAPLAYIMPTIEQILLNRQKLELKKELEKDITKDAIKNEQFEIYN